MPHRIQNAVLLCLLTVIAGHGAVGCASAARYDVVAPAALRGEIPLNAGEIVTLDKIDYEIFQAEDKIVVRFVNRTGALLRLSEQSVVRDQAGRSFVIDAQEIAPDQSGRVLLPPAFAAERGRPPTVATEVRVGGIDEGGLIGTRRDQELNEATGGSAAGSAAPDAGFRWRTNGQARLRLVYQLGDAKADLTHEWVIRRAK